MKNASHKAAVSLFAVIFITSVFFGSTANANITGESENEEGIEQSSQVFGLLEGDSENGGEGVSLPVPPSITSISPVYGPFGTSVTITGLNFAATGNQTFFS